MKEAEEIEEKWKVFIKDVEQKRGVKEKRKLDPLSHRDGNLAKKGRFVDSTAGARMFPAHHWPSLLAIEYIPDKEVLQNRRGVAVFPSSENRQTKIEYPAISYKKLLALEYAPVSEEHTPRRDRGPEKVILKWKTKRKTGELSSMKVLDLKAHFKSLSSSLKSENKIMGGRGQERVDSPKRKLKNVNQETSSSPSKKFKNARNFWVGREGSAKSVDKFETNKSLPISPD